MGIRVEGSGFGVYIVVVEVDAVPKVQGLGVRVWDLEYKIKGFG